MDTVKTPVEKYRGPGRAGLLTYLAGAIETKGFAELARVGGQEEITPSLELTARQRDT